MPSISTMLYPAPGYVRVEVNWADVGQATGAAVYRVDCLTGDRVPLRPYVAFDGDFLTLSCGYGIFWDTEPQLDRCVYYCTQAQDAAGVLVTTPADLLMYDTFTRVVASGWGTSTSGQLWTTTGGAAADHSVTGTRGQQALTNTGVARIGTFAMTTANYGVRVTAFPTVLTSGASLEEQVWLRSDGTDQNGYRSVLSYQTTGLVNIFIQKRIAGVTTTLTSASGFLGYDATTQVGVDFRVWGNTLALKVWDQTGVEPAAFSLTTTDTTYTAPGNVSLLSIRNAGNTNGTVNAQWDNLSVYNPCAEPQAIETCSDDLVVPSSGEFRLGDPMRPCNDVTLQFQPNVDPDCVPTQGIFFANMSDEDAEANSGTFAPVNSVYPIGIYRARRSLNATLTTLTRTFADRDAMRQLNAPGGPLLLRGPAQYGIADRYMLVGNVTEHRQLSDHRVQPRAVTLPHVQLDYPYGPSQGVCGTRVEDLCDIYGSWDAIVAAGLTYADLLRGKASNDTPIPDTVERTWSDVNATYANWTAVNAGNTDWDDLLDGA